MTDAPKTIGPYLLLEPIGRGGMGVVYRARHVTTGESVALKTVRVPEEALLAGFRREIRALARIRHPDIVRILDTGLESGLPWYAMELIEGTPLSALTRPASSGPDHAVDSTRAGPLPAGDARSPVARSALSPSIQIPDAVAIVRRLCAPLAFLHGEGIVHRDLKPSNVILRPSGWPVLVDFGLAVEASAGSSREQLDAGWEASGTLAYMAPEQLLGELVDARADLYSLGCLLYELLTGRTPFRGSVAALQLAQVTHTPAPASSFNPEVPRDLDEIVRRLLAKSPRDRIGHADDVAAALARLAAGQPPLENDSARPRPKPYLYRPAFAGRGELLDRLERRLARVQSSGGGTLFVEGESGVGKTRLAVEIARLAVAAGLRVVTGECLPPEPGSGSGVAAPLSPFAGLFQSIADRCRRVGARDSLPAARARLLAPFAPPIAELPAVAAESAPAILPPEAARLRLFAALLDVLRALAADQPIVLILDDLQWADELTIGFLDHVVRGARLSTEPILLAGFMRAGEVGPSLREIAGLNEGEHVTLGRLAERDVGAIVADMLALEPPPDRLSAFLARQSEGNPFFVAEYLRAALEVGVLARDDAGVWRVRDVAVPDAGRAEYERLALPEGIRDLVARRLAGLPEPALAIARIAAVFGRDVPFDLLRAAAPLDEPALLDATAELLRRHVLEEPAPGVLRFTHDKLREGAYAAIDREELASLHRIAAETIETVEGGRRPESFAALGLHWELAGERDRARACDLAGARAAAARFALDEAGRLYRAYLALVEAPDAEVVTARNELATDVLRVRGQLAEAIREHERALAEARAIESPHAELEALTGLALSRFVAGDHTEAEPLLERALVLARELGDARREGQVLGRLGLFHHERGRSAEAFPLYERAIATLRVSGDRRGEAVLLGNLANLNYDVGRHDEAERLYELALAGHREVGDELGEGRVLGNLASFFCFRGELARAREPYERALEINQRIGNRRDEGIVLNNLATLHMNEGRPEEARAFYGRSYEIHRASGFRRYAAAALASWAVLERRLGNLERAAGMLDEAVRELRDVGDALYATIYHAERGYLALARGGDARPILEEARELARELEAGAGSEVGLALAALERALGAAAAGGRLWQGEPLEELPAGFRRWLEGTSASTGSS